YVEAHAVRAEDADAGALKAGHDLHFEVGHLVVAGLTKAGGEEVNAAYSFGDVVLDQLGDDAHRHAGDYVIDRPFDNEHAGVALEALDLLVLGVDGIDRRKAEFHEREEET